MKFISTSLFHTQKQKAKGKCYICSQFLFPFAPFFIVFLLKQPSLLSLSHRSALLSLMHNPLTDRLSVQSCVERRQGARKRAENEKCKCEKEKYILPLYLNSCISHSPSPLSAAPFALVSHYNSILNVLHLIQIYIEIFLSSVFLFL